MNLVLLQNANAGRGAGRPAVQRALRALADAGHATSVFDVGPGRDTAPLADALRTADAMVVAGGDGTLHHAAEHAVAAHVPVYHLPLGTENLFARQFRMDRRPETLLRALARPALPVDVGLCNGTHFLLMCSVGFDACVVQRVAAARTRGVHRVDYVAHGLRELVRPRFPALTVLVDGRPVVADRPGLVVVANSRQYAARLDPIPHASMTDGLLDVLFLPFRSRLRLASWGLATLLRRHLASRAAVQAQGASVTITGGSDGVPHQLDGECGLTRAGAPHRPAEGSLSMSVLPGALRVLSPV